MHLKYLTLICNFSTYLYTKIFLNKSLTGRGKKENRFREGTREIQLYLYYSLKNMYNFSIYGKMLCFDKADLLV